MKSTMYSKNHRSILITWLGHIFSANNCEKRFCETKRQIFHGKITGKIFNTKQHSETFETLYIISEA